MNREKLRRWEIPLIALLIIFGSAFLLKMAYMPLLLCSALGAAYLVAVYLFVRARYGIEIPLILLLLVFGGVQVDAVGNFFRMFGRKFGPLDYDEFAHMAVQVLTTPLVVWLLREALKRFGYPLPLGLVTFFAITTIFSLSAFYEIIEMWDELYFGGQRIWSTHDAPNDLQWNFAGILLGAALAYAVLHRTPERAVGLKEEAAAGGRRQGQKAE